MAGVFISYQKSSTRHMVGRLNASLTHRFGAKQIFRDDATLKHGQKWWPRITEFIQNADVMLVVMGDDWTEHLNQSNANSSDGTGWVQKEILLAVEHGVPIVPVLVDGAEMPSPDDLPDAIADLPAMQAAHVADRSFDHDVGRLGDTIEHDYEVSDTRTTVRRGWERFKKLWIAAASIIGVVAAGIAIWVFVRGENRPPKILCSVELEAVAGVPTPPLDITGCVEDPDGNALTIVAEARSDREALIDDQGDGTVIYTAPFDVFGQDRFEYEAVDGDSATADGDVFVEVAAGAMDTDLNIAVAQLTAVGETQAASLGRSTTASLLMLVENGLEDETRLSYDVAGPDRTGPIAGVTFDEQAETVEDISQRLNAHVVLYGVVSVDGSTTVEPRIYLSPVALEQAIELAGPYALREASVSSTNSAAVGLELEKIVEPTVQAIVELSRGMAFYQTNQYAAAEEALLSAVDLWPVTPGDSNGREALYQLLGNVAGELAFVPEADDDDTPSEEERLEQAAAYFQLAIDLGDDDARSRFGLNEVRFLQARGPKCGADEGGPNLQALDDAAEEFVAIQDLPEPDGSFLHARSRVEVGRVLLCLTVNGEDRLADARSALQGVIDDFGAVGELEDLIGEAHQALGFSYSFTGDFVEAIDQYRAAIAISNEESRRAFFHNTIGGIYECDLADPARARLEYDLSDSLVAVPLERRDCTVMMFGD